MANTRRGLSMPLIKSIELQNFSLYRLRKTVSVPLDAGVTALVGANGIGKSTFLAATIYGATGTVPPPNPRFNSISAYHSLATSYALRFFDGRVREQDRDAATVRMTFRLATFDYDVLRPLFSPSEVSDLSVRDDRGRDLVRKKDRQSPDTLRRRYEELVTQHTALASFSQYVFISHFLLAFDERRHLLFFDQDVAEKIIYLVFGVDPSEAEKADEMRKAADAADSLMRNFQYDATVARKQLEELRIAVSSDEVEPPSAAVLAEYEVLREQRRQLEDELASLLSELNGARLSLAEAAARLHQAESAYTDTFSRRLQRTPSIADNTLIRSVLADSTCVLCGTSGKGISQYVRGVIEQGHCPICASNLRDESVPPEAADILAAADQDLASAHQYYDAAQSRVERLTTESTDLRARQAELEGRLRSLESGSPELAAALDSAASATVDAVESRLRGNILTAEQRKEAERTKRDQALAELRPLQQTLMAAFAAAEREFVPRFRELAEEFIGLPLDVSLTASGRAKVGLALSVQGQRRSAAAQLSESQRYFLDVALRMALAEQLAKGREVELYIDTPEGALDIAYEARVGSMFAKFVEQGNRLLITANVNSSQLLLRMADECGPSRMRLIRMTDWTTLSDVQVAEQDLFDEALSKIESRLKTPRTSARSTSTEEDPRGRAAKDVASQTLRP